MSGYFDSGGNVCTARNTYATFNLIHKQSTSKPATPHGSCLWHPISSPQQCNIWCKNALLWWYRRNRGRGGGASALKGPERSSSYRPYKHEPTWLVHWSSILISLPPNLFIAQNTEHSSTQIITMVSALVPSLNHCRSGPRQLGQFERNPQRRRTLDTFIDKFVGGQKRRMPLRRHACITLSWGLARSRTPLLFCRKSNPVRRTVTQSAI